MVRVGLARACPDLCHGLSLPARMRIGNASTLSATAHRWILAVAAFFEPAVALTPESPPPPDSCGLISRMNHEQVIEARPPLSAVRPLACVYVVSFER